ncbi:MAG TPA: hypothetical protein VF789_13895 [Thermoanaerobaculia bacterium]
MKISTRLLAAGALALLAAASPLSARPGWIPRGPSGGVVTSLANAPGALYAATLSGVYKTLNGGASWAWLPGAPGGGGQVAVDPQRPATVYATGLLPGGPLLAKSTNGGATWKPSDRGLPRLSGASAATALVIDPSRTSRLYFGTGGRGIWRSLDGGATWRPASLGLPAGDRSFITALAVGPDGTAFAGTIAAGVFRSTNGGATWSPLRNGLPLRDVRALAVAPSDPDVVYTSLFAGVFRSDDGGDSWQPAGVPGTSVANVLAIHPRDPLTVYAGTPGEGVFKTTDGGGWEPILGNTIILSLALTPSVPETVYAGTSSIGFFTGGVLRSVDGGAHWAVRNRGLSGLDTLTVAVDPGNPNFLLAGTAGQGLFRSGNRGQGWARAPLGFPTTDPIGVRVEEIFATETAGIYYAQLAGGSLWKTEDTGILWRAIPLPEGTLRLARLDPATPGSLYALMTTGLYWSGDDGASWLRTTQPPLTVFHDLAVAPFPSDSPTLYAAGADGTGPAVFRSLDGGFTWTLVLRVPGSEAVALAVDPEDSEVVYASVLPGVPGTPGAATYRSGDAGATWRRVTDQAFSRIIPSPVAGRVYAITSGGGLVRSVDGGPWRPWGPEAPGVRVHDLAIDPRDPDRIYAATTTGVWLAEEE